MKSQNNNDQSTKLWGISLFGRDFIQLLNEVTTHVKEGKSLATLVTPNPEQIVQSARHSKLKLVLRSATWAIPDGVGLVLASRFLAGRLQQPALHKRITGIDTVEALLVAAGQQVEPWRVLVIGGRYFASNPDRVVPFSVGQTQVYWLCGYEDVVHPQPAESALIARTLHDLQPSIVLVAFGAPWQELWIADNAALLEKNGVKLAMVVGGTFDVLTGNVSRAPRWMQQLGLEWLFRLINQPWRWKRQLRLVAFLVLVIRTWLDPRLSNPHQSD